MHRVRDVAGGLPVRARSADAQLQFVPAGGGLGGGDELVKGAGAVGGVDATEQSGEVGRRVVELGRDLPAQDRAGVVRCPLDVAGCPPGQGVWGE
jgi:hypothetical protein